ncbi:MAG: glutathione S-transferase N-terminal domain-containing protein [Candidatus Sericytochromatia bacterium]
MILYSAKGSNSSERVEWVLNFKNIPYTKIEVEGEEIVSKYLTMNPYGYVPSLEIEGNFISESMAIIELLEELYKYPSIFPNNPIEKAMVREVCEFVNSTIHAGQNRTLLKYLRDNLTESEKKELRKNWIKLNLIKLEKKLWLKSNFAIGYDFSLADIFIASIYKKSLEHGLENIINFQKHLNFLRKNSKISKSEP